MASLSANLEKGRPYILNVLRIIVALLFLASQAAAHGASIA
jgi:hypothetical protein